ncbi:MAG: enoyl-CoA hydratase/isomerase family protein [Acidimicrobiia bacterium]
MHETLIGSGKVLVDLDDGVAHVRLNRPEAANGMNVPFLKALYEALMRVHGDTRVRAVLLTGEGKHFCAGGDVHTFAAQGEALPDYLREATTWLGSCASALMRLEAPVVAAVHGYAAGGGGFGLVCAADLVVAGESARFLLGATRVGMAPDAGGSVTLARIVGLRKAMEIALTNPTLTAAQALELGLINKVVPDHEVHSEGLALARSLAEGATRALAATKRLLWDGLGATVEARLPEESRTVSELSGTEDAREGLAAVIEKRRPKFSGR